MRFLRKLRFLLFRSRFERELDEELRFHQAMKERDGATVESARRAIGNETLFKEQSRDAWIVAPLDNVLRDIRFACRTFRKNPGFVASATLTLALGLGVNTALFTVFNAFVLRPVPARDPDRLVQLGVAGKDFANFAFSWQDYVVLHEDHRVVEDLMAFADVQGSLAGSNGPDESWAQADLSGLAVSENYFRSLGAETILGRSFVPEADPSLGLRAVVVLSYQAWQRHFHGDPAVVGKTIRLTGHPLTVIGVASAEFTGLDITFPHFWIPAPMYATLTGRRTALEDTSWFRFQIVGRLKPDVSMAQARDALTSAIPSLNEHRIGDLRPDRMRLVSKKTIVPFDWRMVAPMMPIIIAFGLVLLISCANIANLLLARATARQQEVAVRVALGAGRGRLIHQLLTESTLLALGGGLLGFAFAHWIMTIVSKEVLPRVPTKGLLLVREIDVDSHAFLYVLALACVTGLLFGLAPALAATRPDVSSALKSDGYSAFTRVRPGTLRKGLVVVQLTVSLVLLIAASVLLRTAIRLQLHDPGYSVDRIVAAGIPAQQQNAPDVHALIAERLSRMPQVLSLAFSWRLPLSGRLRLVPVALAQMPDSRIPAGFNHVSPAYFETLRIPLVQGRTFTAQEARLEANVAVVSAALAARLWPNDAPVGQYLPLHEQGHLLVRVDGDPRTTSEQIRLQFASIDPYLHVGVRPLSDTIDAQLIPFRIASGIAMVIGLLGLTLSAIGVYGVMSYGVVQRTQEIGVRMALGAERQDVLWMILRESLRLTAIGCSVGVGLAFAFCRVLAGFVPNFLEFDSASFTLPPLVLALVALLATLLPARRAAQVDPMITLRYE